MHSRQLAKPFPSSKQSCQSAMTVFQQRKTLAGSRVSCGYWKLGWSSSSSLKNFWQGDDNLSSTVILQTWQEQKNRGVLGRIWKSFTTLQRNDYFLVARKIAWAFVAVESEHLDWPLRTSWCNLWFNFQWKRWNHQLKHHVSFRNLIVTGNTCLCRREELKLPLFCVMHEYNVIDGNWLIPGYRSW